MPDFFRKIFNHENDNLSPRELAVKMAKGFKDDLDGRLKVIVGQHDSEYVKYALKPYEVEETDEAGLSLRIYVNPDRLKHVHNTLQQIRNAVWGTENEHKPTEIRILEDTIKTYYESSGKVKVLDKSGNLTTQMNYIFRAGKK